MKNKKNKVCSPLHSIESRSLPDFVSIQMLTAYDQLKDLHRKSC